MQENKTNQFSLLRERTGFSVKETAQFFNKSERTIYRWENGESEPNLKALNTLQIIADSKSNDYIVKTPNFNFIDLFAGIGGLRRAFEAIGGKCVFTSEWDAYCRKTYQANFECDHDVNGDIRDVDLYSMPDFDLLLAGFPCQPFSIAGVSKKRSLGRPDGFRDNTQGTLFFDVAQMIEYHRPKAFLLENVKNLLTHDKGRTFNVIMRTLQDELGYNVDYKVINAKGWVPQNRERIFIVGFKEDVGFSFENFSPKDPLTGPKLKSILHPEDGSEKPEFPFTDESGRVNEKYTLSDKLWSYLQGYAEKHRLKGNGFGYGLNGQEDVARTLSARYYKDGSEILIRQSDKNPRRLTPRECARLMGFDQEGRDLFKIPVSDTQAYKQFGNSVVVPVVEAIARHMLPYILDAENDKSLVRNEQLDIFKMIEHA
ncbi:DNA (cytosine-5-)-methyltransferase [Bacillus sp. FJAT-49711]|uniref:DNA (cytosine-5-)-methyltransferase n=1 Tax=Bacillus sp. FJAT-49711 TaxID=2833585 RepID=UPI001BC8EA82|nr:DNA (cytosine-5-)-methyltransferase [Bacillus sp. FJAT-49711]MBS4218327.1 DNA (cytosine-5-)-methyltransferase [Bacillus sp. FJAT-49711]